MKTVASVLCGMVLAVSGQAIARDFSYGLGVKAGTLGSGLDLSMTLTPKLNLRLALTRVNFTYNHTLNLNDPATSTTAVIDSTLDTNFGATALMLDWYVFDGTFHLSAGMFRNDSKASLKGKITSASVTFNGVPYNATQDFVDPTVTAVVKLGNGYDPYLGIGWGRKASNADPGWSVSAELGVLVLSPSVDLFAPTLDPNGPAAANGVTQSQLDAGVNAAEASANKDLSRLKAWPVLSLGINYAF